MGNISQTPFLPSPLIVGFPGSESAAVTAAVTAGAAYFSLVNLLAPVTIAQMRVWFGGTPSGNVDMGIYDSTGTNGQPNNLLGHTGANAAVAGLFTKSLTANLLLSPGNYWLAVVNTAANSLSTRGSSAGGAMYITAATNLTVLPSTAGTVNDTLTLIQEYALVSGGYS